MNQNQDATIAAVVASLRTNYRMDATLEYPGFIQIPSTVEGQWWAIGTANGTWAGDLTDVSGELIAEFDTGIDGRDASVAAIAQAIAAKVMDPQMIGAGQ